MAKTGYAPLRRKTTEETTLDSSDDDDSTYESNNKSEAFPSTVLGGIADARTKMPIRTGIDKLANANAKRMKKPNLSAVTNSTESPTKTTKPASIINYDGSLTDGFSPEEIPLISEERRATKGGKEGGSKRKKPAKSSDDDEVISGNKKKQTGGMPWLLNLVGPPGNWAICI